MPIVVGVRFKRAPKIYYFEAGELEYTQGCKVLVETSRGLEVGKVVMLPREVEEEKIVPPLKPVIRLASQDDLDKLEQLEQKRPQVMEKADQLIKAHQLNMKLVDAEYTFDEGKLVLYFTAENRVDFRELVRDLAAAFKTRIELKQIGARDECKLKGGLGPCGRACCCSDYITEFAHVTIKMAKNQNLSLNPSKISGLCGRLMCCLAYENEHYSEVNRRMPKVGSQVQTTDGNIGTVLSINHLKESVVLRVNDKDIFTNKEYSLDDVIPQQETITDDIDNGIPEELKELED